MIEESIYKFKSSASIILPEVIDNYYLGKIIPYEDYAILPYELKQPLPLDRIVSLLDEANYAILYHIVPDQKMVQTAFGQKCCAYNYPTLDQMYKINCQTSSDGLVHELLVTVYGSLEDFCVEIRKDLQLNERQGGTFITRRQDGQIVNDFNVHR